MRENELKCKLEQMASGMGAELNGKFKEEINPLYKLLQTFIIFGFLTVFLIIGSFYMNTYNTNNCSIKTIEEPRVQIVEKIIIKEVIKYRNIEDYFKDKYLFKVDIINGSKYFYYRKELKNKTYYFTKAVKID